VQLPTGAVRASAELYWLYDHFADEPSPPGVRYLQWRKRLEKAGETEKLEIELAAYKKRLPELQKSFLRGLAGLQWDLAIQAPSCSPHAGEFAVLAPNVAKHSLFSIFACDCKQLGPTNSAEGATVEHLAAAMFPTQPLPKLDGVRQGLIIDDVYGDGKTAAAVIRKLRANSLAEPALVSVATVLRALPTKPKPRKNWLRIAKQSSAEAT
jgi:hypothetical protein